MPDQAKFHFREICFPVFPQQAWPINKRFFITDPVPMQWATTTLLFSKQFPEDGRQEFIWTTS
jgi:hypothetical protein